MSGCYAGPAIDRSRSIVACVNLNAAIDRTYYLPQFAAGAVWRVGSKRDMPGGKGANVARVLTQLGCPARMIGFVGGRNGAYIRSELEAQGIASETIEVAGESRVCLNIVAEETGVSTELLERGPAIDAADLERMAELVRRTARDSAVVVLSGSLPQGAPADYYRRLIVEAQGEGAPVLLDTSGEALRLALEASPYLVKPNEDEIAVLTGRRETGDEGRLAQVRELLAAGVAHAVLSLGADGAIAGCRRDRPDTAAVPGRDTAGSEAGAAAVLGTDAAGAAAASGRDAADSVAGATAIPGGASALSAVGSEAGASSDAGGALFYRVRSPRLQPVNTVGCGDAFTAGLAAALVAGRPFDEALRLAAAAGAANALTDAAGWIEPDECRRLLGEAAVERLPSA